jgi:hypothetical protein
MTTATDGKNRTRPSSPIYRIIMVEFERQRLARGLSMAQVDDLAGTQDGFYSRMIYPDTPYGRQARWETVQDVADALFGRGFEVNIVGPEAGIRAAPSIEKGASSNALRNRHWRHTKHFSMLGSLGAKARNAKMSPEQRSRSARKAVKTRWKREREARRQGDAHKRANEARAT